MRLKTRHFSKKASLWLLNRKWLWFSTKVPFVAWDSCDIDKTTKYHKGYKHFLFRGCVACDKFTDNKNAVLKRWFAYNNKQLLEMYKK